MQLSVIEFGRNMCGLEDANSIEFAPNAEHPVIHLMEHQKRTWWPKWGLYALGQLSL